MRPPPLTVLCLTTLLAVGTTAACTAHPGRRGPTATTTEHITRTITRPPSAVSAPRSTPRATSTGALRPRRPVVVKKGVCPYIGTQAAQDINGSKINPARSRIVTTDPVGCRFFALNPADYGQHAPAGRPEIEIATARYRTAADAEQGMVATALKGTEVSPVRVAGHEGAQFRTRFSPTDGDQDWACTFVTGTIVVTVKTDRTDLAFNAVKLATAIAPRFH